MTTQKLNTEKGEESSSAQQEKTVPSASGAMTHAELMKKLRANPRFKEAGKPGDGFIVVGAKR